MTGLTRKGEVSVHLVALFTEGKAERVEEPRSAIDWSIIRLKVNMLHGRGVPAVTSFAHWVQVRGAHSRGREVRNTMNTP